MSPSSRAGRPWRRAAITVFAMVASTVGLAGPVSPAAPAAAATTPAPRPLTTAQALSQAHLSGRAVPVTAATTATSTLTAEPDGQLTFAETAVPVRKMVAGAWTPLDATLRTNPDGTVAPAVAYGSLTLSGGGSGPLATMAGNGTRVAISLPLTLPAPVLAGPTATYRDVVPGVDVVATADTTGGFSEVLVVRTAAALASPLVRSLALGVDASGVTMSADAYGNITGRDATGRAVVTAPTPQMWDSGRPAVPVRRGIDRFGRAVDTATGAPVDSGPDGPGEAAARGALTVTAGAHAIRLGLDARLLRAPALPVYIDPTFAWTPANGTFTGGWAVISNGSPSTKYWKNSPSNGTDLQSGEAPGVDDVRRALINFTIPSAIFGTTTTVNSAELDIFETWAWNCTKQKVDVYAPAADLTSSNADWNDWPASGYGTLNDQQSQAYGYNGCDAHAIGFDVKTAATNDAHTSNGSQTFLIKADDEGTETTWKRFANSGTNAPSLVIKYNHPPSTPTALHTNPTTPCAGATIGDNAVQLYATFADPDNNTVGEDFKLWKTSNSAVFTESDPNLLYGPSGSSATPYQIPESWFAANSGGVATSYSWQARTYDFAVYSGWTTTTCTFTWDPTRTGEPGVTPPATVTIGQKATFSVVKAPTGTVPTSYLVQLNAGAPFTVAATGGSASFDVYPTRYTDTVSVTGLSAGNNIGDPATVTFTAQPAAVATDADLTGDGNPDLVTVGGGAMAPGLWLSPGNGAGGINSNATSLAPYGNGTAGDDQPSDFTGAQAVTGHFTGSGLQDVLYYYPSGANAGGGGVLNGNGDGSPINADSSGSQHTISGGTLQDLENADNPIQVVNGGNLFGTGAAYPDLIGINGDPFAGYYLDLYQNTDSTIGWNFPVQIVSPPPSGTAGWDSWTLASTQVGAALDVFVWNRTSGDLYLWTNVAYDTNTAVFSYTQYLIGAGWNTTATAIHAADVNQDGIPDVWVTTGTTSVSYLVTNLTGGTGTATAQSGQTVVTAAHTWTLHDAGSGTVGSGAARDSVGPLNASGSGNAKWNAGDLYSPDLVLDGSTNTMVSTGTAALGSGDFSVSAWVKPAALTGVVASQDGVNNTLFRLYPNAADATWKFAMAKTDTSGAAEVVISSAANTAQVGVWVHLLATYNASTKAMTLYLNDVSVATGTRVTPWTSTGAFRIGAYRSSSTVLTGFANAQVAGVQTWNSVVTPTMATSAVTYVASAATMGTFTSVSTTLPATVAAGDVMLMFFTTPSTEAAPVPSGWTLSAQTPAGTSLLSWVAYRVATATDHGSTVTVSYGTTAHKASLQVLVYRGVKASAPIGAINQFSTTLSVTSVTSPTVTVPNAGSWLVTDWTAKSSVITAWTVPSGQAVRSVLNGTGSGYLNAVVTDLGATVNPGTAGGYVATTDQPGGSDVSWTVALNVGP